MHINTTDHMITTTMHTKQYMSHVHVHVHGIVMLTCQVGYNCMHANNSHVIKEISHHIGSIVGEVYLRVELDSIDLERLVLDGSYQTPRVGHGLTTVGHLFDGVSVSQQHFLIGRQTSKYLTICTGVIKLRVRYWVYVHVCIFMNYNWILNCRGLHT